MAEEEALHHLARYEKKNLVRGWNSAQAYDAERQRKQEPEPNRRYRDGGCDDDSDEDDELVVATDSSHFEPSDRLIQWLRQESAVPVSSAVASQWESQFADHNQQQFGGDDTGEEAIPLTSGQVKHAYRTRARKEEVQQNKRAVALKLQREKLLGLQSGREASITRRHAAEKSTQAMLVAKRATRKTTSPSVTLESLPRAPAQPSPSVSAHEEQAHDQRVFGLNNLPASRICVDSELRNETLAVIRKQLIAGCNVLLTSDCGSAVEAGSEDSLSDSKLMMQQLCTQSLMYCVREQEVVPEVDHNQQRVRLMLHSRLPWSN